MIMLLESLHSVNWKRL